MSIVGRYIKKAREIHHPEFLHHPPDHPYQLGPVGSIGVAAMVATLAVAGEADLKLPLGAV